MSNEELQKAIDDITRESAGDDAIQAATPSDAPAAAMPTSAMPATMMPADDPASAMPTSDAASVEATSEPIAPPPAAPEIPEVPVAEAAVPEAPASAPVAPQPVATETAPAQETVDLGEGVTIGADGLIDVTEVESIEKTSNIPTEEPPTNLIKVKQDTLRELFPLMDKLNIDPVEKFGIYKDIIDLTKEHSAIEAAHETVLQIADEQTRADALLELLEIIASFKV